MLGMKMKSLCIFALYALLILCGFVDWTYSHPATILEIDGANTVVRNIKSDDGLTDGKYVTTGVNHGRTADPMLERVYPERNAKTTKTNKDTKSLAGNDARGSQANKPSKKKTPAQGEKKTFLQKLRSFFVDGPVKVWKKIKQWFSRANTSKSNETNVKKPKRNWMKDLLQIFKSKKTSIEKPLKETPKDSSVLFQKLGKETPQKVSKDTTPLKAEYSQQGTLGAQHLPDSNQLDKVNSSPDDSPAMSNQHQNSKDTTFRKPSSTEDMEANSDNISSHMEGQDLTKIQDTDKGSPKTHQRQEGITSFDSDHKKEGPSKEHPKVEEKPSAVLKNEKAKTLQQEIEVDGEIPSKTHVKVDKESMGSENAQGINQKEKNEAGADFKLYLESLASRWPQSTQSYVNKFHKGNRPKENLMKETLPSVESKKSASENPLKETPKDSSVHAQTSQKEIPQEETNDPTTLEEEAMNATPLKERESQQETLVVHPLPDSHQSDKVNGTPDDLSVIPFKHQESNDITVENPSRPKDLEAKSESSASILEQEEDPTKVQDTEKVSQENPQQQEGLKIFDSYHMNKIPINKDHEEEKPSVVIENDKIKPLQHKIKDEKELPINKHPEEEKIDVTPDDSPVSSRKYQQPNDIDVENESGIEELEANPEHLAPDTEGHNDHTKIQDIDESSPEQPHRQGSLASFDSDHKEESARKKHPKEKSSVTNGNEKYKAPQQEIEDEEESPGNMPAKENNHHWLLKKMKLTFLSRK